MPYFFQRKKDNYIFAVDKESEAANIYYEPRFKDRFEYLGISDGKIYEQELKKMRKISKRDYMGKLAESIASQGIIGVDVPQIDKDIVNTAFNLELEEAKKNKMPPRKQRVVNLDGGVVDDSSILRMIPK